MVILAFNNPCEDSVAGAFRRTAGGIGVGLYDPIIPDKPEEMPVCPAVIHILTYQTTVSGVKKGSYQVSVFQSRDTTYWTPTYARVSKTISVP